MRAYDKETGKGGNPVNGLYIDHVDTATNTIYLQRPLTVALKKGDKVRR